MKKKTKKAIDFIESLHDFIKNNPQLRRDTKKKTESQIQTEIRPMIVNYLENYFLKQGNKDYLKKAQKTFYWEGQEGKSGQVKQMTFEARNYPDFIIKQPYKIAVEYKKGVSGSIVKHGIGQSIIHTLSGEFDYVYFLFQDETPDKRIRKSACEKGSLESKIIDHICKKFNVFIRFI